MKQMPIQDNYEYRILDMQCGRCITDYKSDTVFLTAFASMNEVSLSDINLIIKNKESVLKIEPEANSGYRASAFCGNFLNSKFDQVLLTISDGQTLNGYLYSIKQDITTVLFESELFNQRYKYRVTFKDFFEAEIISADRGERHLVLLSEKCNKLYNREGILLKETAGRIGPLCALHPEFDEKLKRYRLIAYQKIIGADQADLLGYLATRLLWNGREFVITEVFTEKPEFRC